MKSRVSVFLFLVVSLGGCASLPDNSERTASYADSDTRDTTMGRFVDGLSDSATGEDAFILLDSGLDAFVARAVLAEFAEKTLDAQYYLYHDDLVGGLFTGYLVGAADRGVRVRLLVEDLEFGVLLSVLIAIDAHPNIEVRVFNPFNRHVIRTTQLVTGLGSLTRRMHNKSFTADNQMSILGGRNIGDEYFDADPTLEFADLDVLVVGNVVQDISESFDQYWNSDLAYPIQTLVRKRLNEEDLKAMYDRLHTFMEEQQTSNYMTALLNSDLAERIRDGKVQYFLGDAVVVVDDPEKITSSRDADELHLMTQLAPYFHHLDKELIIVSPYFVPGEEGVDFFSKLVDKGVQVRILTNSLSSNDVGVVHAGYSKYRKPLLRAGVELYEMNKKLTRAQRKEKKGVGASSKASLHAKTFVLDREKVFIGSLNLDPRSFYENTEIGLVLDQPELAREMAESFDADIDTNAFRVELKVAEGGGEKLLWHGYENGEPVTFEVDPYTSFWRRLGVGFARLLPIESQL